MKILATNKFKGSLDLSSKEDFHNKNPIEKLPFRVTIKSGQTITVDDKWYTLHSIQSALKIGYIEILDFKEQHVFTAEVKIPENHTINYNLTLVEILNRADYPQDAFEKINKNFIEIDNLISQGGGGGGGGATKFIQLIDTPNNYIGSANKVVSVNGGENGLVFSNLYLYNGYVNVGSGLTPSNLNVYGGINVASITIHGYVGSSAGEIFVGLPDGTTISKYLINGLLFDSPLGGPIGSNLGAILIGLPDGTTQYKTLINGIICDF